MNGESVVQELAHWRDQIDAVDLRLVTLLNERTRIVEQIGQIKRRAQLPVYEPKREDEVFRNISDGNQGPLPDASLRRIFERIIDEMRTVQRERMKQEES